jgi:hypothetical protein
VHGEDRAAFADLKLIPSFNDLKWAERLTSVGAELRFANHISLLAKFDGAFAVHTSTYAGTGTTRYSW